MQKGKALKLPFLLLLSKEIILKPLLYIKLIRKRIHFFLYKIYNLLTEFCLEVFTRRLYKKLLTTNKNSTVQ